MYLLRHFGVARVGSPKLPVLVIGTIQRPRYSTGVSGAETTEADQTFSTASRIDHLQVNLPANGVIVRLSFSLYTLTTEYKFKNSILNQMVENWKYELSEYKI